MNKISWFDKNIGWIVVFAFPIIFTAGILWNESGRIFSAYSKSPNIALTGTNEEIALEAATLGIEIGT
jgi:hypothetical protein